MECISTDQVMVVLCEIIKLLKFKVEVLNPGIFLVVSDGLHLDDFSILQ